MRALQILRILLTMLVAFALSMPLFWMIDALQSHQVTASTEFAPNTLRFDESRSEQDTLSRVTEGVQAHQIRHCTAEESPLIAASTYLLTATGTHAPQAVLRSSCIPPPALQRHERQQLSRLLMPLSPHREVPTTPPLVAA